MNLVKKIAIACAAAILLSACEGHEKKKEGREKVYQVKKSSVTSKLYFTGNIQPLSEYSLSTSVEAVVDKVYIQYGQWVKKGDIILSLNSNALQKQYNETLTEYLKAKDNFSVAQSKFEGTESLWQAGLIAKNNYLSERSSLDNARINLMQASSRLLNLLNKMDDASGKSHEDLYDLSFAQFDKVRKALSAEHHMIQIRAPVSGILLYPAKSGTDSAKSLMVGHAVKADEVIGLIGDLNGIRIEIDIPEIDIDKIHPGMQASISGPAFEEAVLTGQVISVNAQASEGSGNGLPSFKAIIEVDKLNATQKKQIKVGMSAQVALISKKTDALLIPIQAIRQKDEQSFVAIKDQNGKLQEQPVSTGASEGDLVVVRSGLHDGDRIVYG